MPASQEFMDYHAESLAELKGLSQQMDKRIEFMERLYISIDRKLWAIILLVIGAIVIPLIRS